MIHAILCAFALLSGLHARAAEPAAVRVLDGPEVQPLRDGLKRVGVDFADLKSLDARSLAGCAVLVVCGTRPPVDEAGKQAIARYVEAGGAVLGVGGGAGRLVDLGLADAEAYYMPGTTLHNTGFDGYHRLTFGYPLSDPRKQGTTSGVGYFLRATGGPLMKPGPTAASILSAGGGYSLAALQRLGRGRLLLIGGDPQGGKFFSDLNKSRPMPGSETRTDALLANAVAFLLDPHSNLIPNSGFEDAAGLAPAFTHWEIIPRAGARHEWRQGDAAEGQACLALLCPEKNSSAEARPLYSIVVESGQTYRFACHYKSAAPWELSWQWGRASETTTKPQSVRGQPVPASVQWTRFEAQIAIPPAVSYARPWLQLAGPAEMCLDDVTLRLEGGQPE